MSYNKQIKSAIESVITNPKKAGTSVTRTPVTKTVNATYGDEILTEGTVETITNCYFSLDFKKLNRYFITKQGEVESGDAFIFVKADQTLNKNDIITYDSRDYRVADVYRVVINNVLCGSQGNLFLIE